MRGIARLARSHPARRPAADPSLQNGGSSASSEIAAWVEENFTATTVDDVTLYDLSAGGAATTS